MRSQHYSYVTATKPAVDWFEVHTENFFGDGGTPHAVLAQVRQHYPVSFHGIGLSLGSTDELNRTHLKQIKALVDRYQPALVSEHLSWGSINGIFLHDLLPLPMTFECAKHLSERIQTVQDFLKCQLLVENASTYLEFVQSEMSEWEFITEIAESSGCGILLDINNIYVNACNHGINSLDFINRVPSSLVSELHLAGHTIKKLEDGQIRIDTHNQRVCKEVWELYELASKRFPLAPTLIEWDKDLPTFEILMEEAEIARDTRNGSYHAVA